MNTCTRRFLLRLLVGVLTFAIGVGAAILLGGFSPFRTYASWSPGQYGYRCNHRHSRLYVGEGPESSIFLLKGPRGIRMSNELRPLPPLPPVVEAPIPPAAELPLSPAQSNPPSNRR